MKSSQLSPLLLVGLVVVIVGVVGENSVDLDDSSDIEIVNLGDNCGEKSVCDKNSHLACTNLQCHCDSKNNYILDTVGVKCVLAKNSDEIVDYEEDGNDNSSEWTDSAEEESGEDHHEDAKENDVQNKNVSSIVEEKETNDIVLGNDDKESANATAKEQQQPEQLETAVEPKQAQQQQSKNGPNHDDIDYKSEHNDAESDDDDDYKNISWEVNDEGTGRVDGRSLLGSCVKDEDCITNYGPLSNCNGVEGCRCNDTQSKLQNGKTTLVNGTCYLVKEIGSDCLTHEECDAVISGPAWCHTDKESNSSYCTCRPFHVWDEERKECLPFATEGIYSSCVNDDQCSAPEALGPLSKCSEVTGKCECLPGLGGAGGNTRDIIVFEDRCIEERDLGDSCSTDQDCQASLGASATCLPSTLTCACQPGHFCNQMLVRPAMSGFTMVVLVAICVSVLVGFAFCIVFRKRGRGGEAYSFIKQQHYENDRDQV